MKDQYKRLKGRPVMKSGKRTRKVDVRFTEAEFDSILLLEKSLGIRRTELIRMRVLQNVPALVVNAGELMLRLDRVGAELGRVGNNINQLAKYANTLNNRGLLSPQLIERFNVCFRDYIGMQQALEISLRKIIRAMGH